MSMLPCLHPTVHTALGIRDAKDAITSVTRTSHFACTSHCMVDGMRSLVWFRSLVLISKHLPDLHTLRQTSAYQSAMHLEVHAKGALKIVWNWRCSPDTTCNAVRVQFCKLYGIPADKCRLECDGYGELSGQPIGQLSSAPATLKFTASFDMTLGLCIWGCLTVCNSAIDTPAELLWSTGAHMLSAAPFWDVLQLNTPQELSKLVALPADTSVPESFAAKASDTCPPDWSAVDSSVHPLLLLMHAYMETAPMFHAINSVRSLGKTMTVSASKVVKSLITSHPSYASRVHAFATPSDHIQKLRAALLLLKVVSLLSTIQAPDTSLHDAETSIFTALAHSIQANQKEMRESEMSEAKLLSSHIMKMAIPAIKPSSSTNSTGSFCCCLALQRLILCGTAAVYRTLARHTASEIVNGGGIPVLIAAIGTSSMAEKEQSRVTAAAALGVLQSLTSKAVLPSAIVGQAEDLMLRLQALPRLSSLLRSLTIAPTRALGKTTGSSDLRLALCETHRDAVDTSAPCSVPERNSKPESWLQVDQDPWSLMFTIAELMNRILKRQPIPADSHRPLPNPSAAAWTTIQAMAEQVAHTTAYVDSCEPEGSRVRAVIKGHTSVAVAPGEEHYHYIRLQQELVALPCNLLAGHLPNLDLDVGALMRAKLSGVLADWAPLPKLNVSLVSLGFAFVRRLARDSSILLLQPEDLGTVSREHKCLGCPECCGPVWKFKTETVATLYDMFRHQASKPACHTAAAASVQALYLVLSKDTEQCKHLLVATHVMMDVAAIEQSVTKARDSAYMQKLRKGLHVAVQALAGCLPTQLIAIACLARLCSQEVKQAGREPAATRTPWFMTAVKEGTWDLAYTCIFSTLEASVPVPWSPLLCSALAAAMSMMADLQTGVVDRPSIIKHAVPALQFAERLLGQLAIEPPMVCNSKADQYRLLSACVDFINAFAEHTAVKPRPKFHVPEGLFRHLTHALMDYTYDTEQLEEAFDAAKAQQQGPDSLGWTGGELRSLQPRILSCSAAPCETIQPMLQFWKLAMPNLPHAFALHVETAMDPELSAPDDRPDMAPYLAMLERFYGLGGESSLLGAIHFPLLAPDIAVLTMLRGLSYFTICLVESEEKLGKAKHVYKSALRMGVDTAGLVKELTKAEGRLAKDKSWFDVLLDSLERMHTRNMWAPAFATLPDKPWHGAYSTPASDHPSEFESLLAKALAGEEQISRRLSPAVARRLQACFSKSALDQQASVQPSASRTEDSARTACEELMLEEEQAATKAAAKKAKKLKQKAKKKNKQQAVPVVVDEPTAQPSSGEEEEEDQFRLLQATAPSPGPEAGLDVPSAEQLPSALSVLQLDTGLPATAPAANSAAEAISSSLFSPAQSLRPQEVVRPGAVGGSPGSQPGAAGGSPESQPGAAGGSPGSQPWAVAGSPGSQAGAVGGSPGSLYKLLCCPLTQVMMVDPVIAADGHTYERAAFQDWLHHSAMSPVDKKPLKHTRLVTNLAIKNALAVH